MCVCVRACVRVVCVCVFEKYLFESDGENSKQPKH